MTRNLTRFFDRPTALAFVLALSLPLGRWLVSGAPDLSVAMEQRSAAPQPQWSWSSQARRAFPRAFERWFDDRFPFRKSLLQLNNLVLWSVLRSIPDDSMVRGKSDWLYLAGEEAMGLYRAHDPFEPAELDQWISTYGGFAEWLRARDCLYLLLLGPDKQAIYPEFLPDWVRREGPETRTDQFLRALADRTRIPAIDLRPTLLAAKSEGLLYFQHGTHWNDRGAWYAYLALIAEMAKSFPIQRPLPLSAFRDHDMHLSNRNWVGDTWFERWHLEQVFTQEAFVREYQLSPTYHIVPEDIRRGPSGLIDGRTRNELQFLPKGMLLSDSYGEWLWTLLAHHFRECLSEKSERFPLGLIEAERPEVVIQVRVERFLMAQLDRLDLGPEEIDLCRDWNRAQDSQQVLELGSIQPEGPAAFGLAGLAGGAGLLRLEFTPGEALGGNLRFDSGVLLPLNLPAGRRFVFLRLPAGAPATGSLELGTGGAGRLLGVVRR
jgi:SGNH hydrolase-like domain, acetyltransferase AlgX